MENLKSKSIGEFVAGDYRTAAIFEKYGIDFCCKGGKSLEEVCETKKIPLEGLLTDINNVSLQPDDTQNDYNAWQVDRLIDHIEARHHRYVEQAIPVLLQYLDKLCKVHGEHNPELHDIHSLFNGAAGELTMHMKKEELILFPHVRRMLAAQNGVVSSGHSCFPTVQNPIAMMMQEHDVEGERFRKIASLSSNYTPPDYACNTYKVAYALLKEFEDDLHLHIHLENNILFPKAIELEKNSIE